MSAAILFVAAFLAGAAGAGAAETIKVCVEPRDAPWASVPGWPDRSRLPGAAEMAKLEGLDPTFARALARRLEVDIEWVPIPWADLNPSLIAGKCQMTICAQTPSPVSPDPRIRHSVPYYTWGLQLAVRKDDTAVTSWEDLRGRTVGYFFTRILQRTLGALGANLVEYRDQDQMFADLLAARPVEGTLMSEARPLDAMIYDSIFVQYRIHTDAGDRIRAVGEPRLKLGYHVSVRAQEADRWLGRVNQAIAAMKADGELGQIVSRYWGQVPP